MVNRQFGMVDLCITRNCNMHCKFCEAAKTHGAGKVMSLETFYEVFDKICELEKQKKIIMKRKFLSFGNAGEPLLHPDFVQMNKYVKAHGWKTGVYTNGLLLTEKKMRDIYSNGNIDTINVSVTGVKTKVYREFQGFGFEKPQDVLKVILKNIENAVRIRNEEHKNTKIAVNYIVTKKTFWHIVKYVKYMKKIGIDEIRFTPLVDRPRKKKNIFVKCANINYIFNVDESTQISPCNNDLVGAIVIGNLKNDDWFEYYDQIVCCNNCLNVDELPLACQVCDKTNFTSFWDYMSMYFHCYLKMKNHKILWRESFEKYKNDLKLKINWYFMNRYRK